MRKKLKLRIISLISLVFIVLLTGCGGSSKSGGNYAWKVDDPDPSKSFFRDQVKYPYSVYYKMARDNNNVNWKIAYMDEKPKGVANPPIIVLIHGKGVFGGYFGHTMKRLIAAGFRVVVPDLPFYGKSLPPNINKNISRTLQHTRYAIHDLIVNKLGIKKAVYLGHSLGGQWVLGYALTFPRAVSKLVLEAPAGLETYRAPLFNPKLKDDINKWRANKLAAKLLKGELAKTEDKVRLFYYFKARNKAGDVVDSPLGYFRKRNEYTDFITQVRVKMIKGNQREYKAYCTTYIRDIYTLGIEMFPTNPMYIYNKYNRIRVPIFVAFGETEPFIPTRLSGMIKKGLKKGIILPFYKTMKRARNKPVVKLYSGVGHFVHTDVPDDFADDVIKFAKTNTVNGASSDAEIMSWARIPDKK